MSKSQTPATKKWSGFELAFRRYWPPVSGQGAHTKSVFKPGRKPAVCEEAPRSRKAA